MKKLLSLFDFSILTGNNRNLRKDSIGEHFMPVSAEPTPTFKTVLPEGITAWVGEQGTDFKAWCKRMKVSTTYTRFDQPKGKLTLERIEVM